MKSLGLLILLGVVALSSMADPAAEAKLRAVIDTLYAFEPHKLSTPEMKAKSDELDAFWTSARKDPATSVQVLRKALGEPSGPAFFYYDGSKLLLSLSKDQSDRVIAVRAIAKADLRGVQNSDYLRTVHWFAANGLDTRAAAFRILDFPGFQAFIPQHVLTLGQNYSLIYMLFPMEESSFVDDLAARLATEPDTQSQKSILLALWYASTPAANAAIAKFAEGNPTSPEAHSFAKDLLKRKASRIATPDSSSIQALREERRKVMKRPISDEALSEFELLTRKIQAGM